MNVSPTYKNRKVNGNRKSFKKRFLRQIHLEQLERRELMAADVAPFHNFIYPHDVDGDFQLSPLDALVVINELNASGPGSLAGKPEPENFNWNIDVDGDNSLSPLDALAVINRLNSGEGELPPVVGVKYEFYRVNSDGSIGDLIPDSDTSTSEPDAVIGTGERIIIRTKMKDLRNGGTTGTPVGIFSAYHDLNFANADNSSAEKLQFQWGEFNRLTINPAVTGGSFTLRFGERTTSPIAPLFFEGTTFIDPTATLGVIKTRLEGIFGVGNIKVSFADPSSDSNPDYAINFIGTEARKDISPEGVVFQNNLISSVQPSLNFVPLQSPSPVLDAVTRAGLNHDIDNGSRNTSTGPVQNPRFTSGRSGALLDVDPNTPAKRTINRMGGFVDKTAKQPINVATAFQGVVDALFVGAQAGLINLNGTITPLPTGNTGGNNLGIALIGNAGDRAAYLTADQVVLPTGKINIVDRLSASNDSFTMVEDAAATTLNVATPPGDFERFGNPFGIIQVSTPTNSGGSVVISTGANPKSVVFTPAKDFFGQTTFTYTTQSSLNDQATATVTIDVTPVNDAPVIVTGGLNYNATEDQTTPLVIAPTQVFSPGPANENSQTISLAIVTGPTAAQGTATINQTTGNLEFTPTSNFFGVVNVVVSGTDSGVTPPGVNNTLATLTITVAGVNDAPQVVQPTTFTVSEDPTSPLTITPAQLFTPGPNEASIQTVTISIVTAPSVAQGQANIVNGALQFTPALNFFGEVKMVVQGTDNGTPPLSTNSEITINVTNVNDPPIAVDDPAFTVIALGDPNTLNVLANDLPGPASEPGTIRVVSVTSVTPPAAGTVSVAPLGAGVVFTPSTDPMFFGTTATFNYTIQDQNDLPATAKVTVTILPPASPFAVDDDYRANSTLKILEGSTATFDVLANDFSRVPLTKILTAGTTPPQPTITNGGPGTVAIEGNLIRYNPEPHRNGEVVFTYAMDDSDTQVENNERRLATVTMLVQERNDPPVAVNKAISDGTEDTDKVIPSSEITQGLSKGPFEDSQTLTVISAIVRLGGGSVSLNGGNITYKPAKDYFGPVEIEYTVQDNGTTAGAPDPLSSTAKVSFTLAPVNDPPVANADPVRTVAENTPFAPTSLTIATADLLSNDTVGPDNESGPPLNQIVSFVPLTGPITTLKGGTVTQVAGNLIYTPAPSYNSSENRGPDSFTYQITDGQTVNQFATDTVTINVTEVNDPPETKTAPEKRVKVEVFAGLPTLIDLTTALSAANWSRGAANEALQSLVLKQKVSDPNVGTVSDFGSTQFTYFAPLNTEATTTFTVFVEDNGSTAGIGSDPRGALGVIEIKVLPFQPSSFRGTVFLDDDADGIQDRVGNDPIEAPIGGVEVTLSFIDPITKVLKTVTEMTAADGSYDFELLPPAEYTVTYSTPQHMINGANTQMSRTKKIDAPGGINTVFNFPVQSIRSDYVTYLEFLSSSFNQNDPSRRRGMHAAINAQGTTDWVAHYGRPTTASFYEVVLSNDGTKAYLSEVSANGSRVRTAELGRRDFFRMSTDNGGQIIRILKDPSEFTNWVDVNRMSPSITARGYLDTVDDFFTQEGWNN